MYRRPIENPREVGTSPNRISCLRRNISNMTMVSMDRLYVLVVGSRLSVGTLTQTASYIAFDVHDHVNVSKQQ